LQHYPASRKGEPALLVLAHGAGAGERHPFMVAVARGLAERGVDVVTFDFPYIQQKRKVPDRTPVLEEAFRAAIDEARRHVTPKHALFIGGKSMGGRMATHLAAQGGADRNGGPYKGVLALGYPLHPPGKPDQPRVHHLPSIQVPVLIVQGERDAFGTPDELRPVIKTMRAPVRLHVVAGGDHSLAVPKTAATSQKEVYATVLDAIASWIQSV